MSTVSKAGSRSKEVVHDVVNLLTFLMKLLGCQIRDSLNHDVCGGTCNYILIFFRSCYCVLNNVLLFPYICLLLAKLFQLTPLSSIWMQTFAFSVMFTANALCVLLTSWKIRNNVLKKWCENFTQYEENYVLSDKLSPFIKRVKTLRVIGPLFSMLVTVGVFGLLPKLPNLVDSITLSYFPRWLCLTLISFGMFIIVMCIVCLESVMIIGSISAIFEFESVSKRMMNMTEHYMKKSVDTEPYRHASAESNSELISLFRQHEKICDLLGHFGSFVNHLQLIIFFVSLPLGCVMLYFLITNIEAGEDKFVAATLILTSLLYIISLCLMGSVVNLKAHEPLKYVWKIPQDMVSEEEARELLMFTTKMTGPPIGYSVCNLFTITFPTSLSLAGTLLTYFIVVIQFKPVDQDACAASVDQNLLSNLTSLLQTLYNSTQTTA